MSQSTNPQKVKFHIFEDERFVDLNLYQFGWERCAPLHSFGPYVRNHYLFHYVISGKGVLLVGDREYPVQRSQGFLIVPGQVTFYAADQNDPWEYVWLEFDGLRAGPSLQLAGLGQDQPVWRSASTEAADAVRKHMMAIVNLAEALPQGPSESSLTRSHALALLGYGYLFLDQLINASAKKNRGSGQRLRDFYVKEAVTYIEQNYQKELSVEILADVCGLNRSYFGRIFKECMGESPQQFLIHYRMAKAAQLLKESMIPVRQVGQMTGYPNQLHFSRAFKLIYGVSPREYRNRNFISPGHREEI